MADSDMPREHVRRADLPWRAADMTECGKPTADLRHVISRTELQAKVARDGVQRAAYSTCMTCLETSRRWPGWDADPVQAMSREFYGGGARHPRLLSELRAIAALVAEHRDEFDGYVGGLAETVSLDVARRAKRTGRSIGGLHGA